MSGQSYGASGRDAGRGYRDGSYAPGAPYRDDDYAGQPAPGGRAARRAGSQGAAAQGSAAGGRAAARRGQKKPGKKRGAKIAMGLGAFVVLVAGAGVAWVYELDGNIKHGQLDTGAEPQKGAVIPGAINILMIGSDSRSTAQDAQLGGSDDSLPHADVEMLLHVSADHKNATVMSIPRDTDTQIPACVEHGKTHPAKQHDQITNSLNWGPGCTVSAVNQLTGVHIDHYMVIDFGGVVSMADAVGGVPICVSGDVYDPASQLKLSKGDHTLSGVAALEFLRTRHGFGNGGDVGRTVAQHTYLSSLIRKLKSSSTLTNPSDVFGLATAASKALTVDDGLAGVTKLVDLANTLAQIPTERITFATMPVAEDPQNKNWVVAGPGAEDLFKTIANDQSLTAGSNSEASAAAANASADSASAAPAAPAPAQAAPAIPPASIPIHVLHGAGSASRASAVQAKLGSLGYHDTVLGESAMAPKTTKIQYSTSSPRYKEEAQQLATALGLPDSALEPTGTHTSLYLLVGPDLTVSSQGGTGGPAQPAAPADVSKATANAQTENAAASDACAQVNTFPLGGLPPDLGQWNGVSVEKAYARATQKGVPDSDKAK